MNLQNAISIMGREGRKINLDLHNGVFEYAECPDGFEFCRPCPPEYCGSCFYKVRASGEFSYSPCPGFGRPREEEGWSEFKTIEIDFESIPPTWQIVDNE
jgi:hypothetical protein